MKILLKTFAILFTILFTCSQLFAGTTGKIAGTLTDKETGEPLIGANVVVTNTQFGAATDLNGQFTILYLPPGNYSVEISYIGYKKVLVNDVRVDIDQTSRLDVQLESESMQTEEIVVVAKRDFIKPDVATSVVSVTEKEIEALPVTSVENVVGLQAGIRNDFAIRGGSKSSVLFMMDGVTLRDPRSNEPTTRLALSSVKEISVERGGFNAEYGQVRSGIVNVVTNEGDKQKYYGSFQFRYRPPGPKYQRVTGTLDVQNPYSFALRPFFDDAVCWTGTDNGAWDKYTKKQYPSFEGWNKISEALNTDDDPTNDLTPLGAQRAFMYEIRKKQPNDQPDYDIDAGFGGPVPFVSKDLGNLRFFASYRSTRDMLLFPLTRPDYRDYDWSLKVNSDISPTMNLKFTAFAGKQFTIRHNWDGGGNYYYPHWPNEIADVASSITSRYDLIALFSDFNFSLSDISHQSYALKFTNTISSKTFYEVSLETFRRQYFTRPSALRDTSKVTEVLPGFYEDSNPFGYWPYDTRGVLITGGAHVAKKRDFSVVNSMTLKADYTSQLNFYNLLKTGFEFNYYDLNFDYGTIESSTQGKTYSNRVQRHVFPIRAALYIQNKLEVEEFTLNTGLRLDYSNSEADWYNISPFDASFFSSSYDPSQSYPETKPKGQWQLSPRLGVSHPITENSKLFFNYGHFKQMPDYESLFRIERDNLHKVTSFGNPNLTLAKTVSYELGFDYLFSNEYLLSLAAFYRDITDQRDYVNYNDDSDGFYYSATTSNSYEDVKGFELSLRKSIGHWITGFANYTYQVNTSGHFGSTEKYDNPVAQKTYDEQTANLYQDRPIPRPYARVNLTFFTPVDFGPSFAGQNIFGDWSLNVLFDWQAGDWVKYTAGVADIPGLNHNVQTVDYYNTNLRLTKTLNVGPLQTQLFIDMNNVFDTKRLWNTGDLDYRKSLHLPKSKAYDNIVGNDKIGDYRKPGVDFQPMEKINSMDAINESRVIYIIPAHDNVPNMYYQLVDGVVAEVSKSRIKQVLKDKAYIDMPNASTFWFLDPRNVFFGIRLSYSF